MTTPNSPERPGRSRLADAYRCPKCGGDHFGRPCDSSPAAPELGTVIHDGGYPVHVPVVRNLALGWTYESGRD